MYNCTSVHELHLTVFTNTSSNCNASKFLVNGTFSTADITCTDIVGLAGHNYQFSVGSTHSNTNLKNQTYIITLAPLPLTNVSVEFNASYINNNTTNFTIVDCKNIADPKYFDFLCDRTRQINGTKTDECQYSCSNVVHGSKLNVTVIRSDFPIIDDGSTWPPETAEETLEIGMNEFV